MKTKILLLTALLASLALPAFAQTPRTVLNGHCYLAGKIAALTPTPTEGERG